MLGSRIAGFFERFDSAEVAICLALNRTGETRGVQRVFKIASRLGDGIFWYTLMISLPILYGVNGLIATVHMVLAGAVGVALYKYLKTHLVRERPYVSHQAIHCAARPLDRYSFPSGHTLHAVSFTIVSVYHLPALGWAVAPFAAMVALSRVLLGLHYPSDVLAGALIGALLATTSIELLDVQFLSVHW